MDRQILLNALVDAYELGLTCGRITNERIWSSPDATNERRKINAIMLDLGCGPVSDDEYEMFNV
jgi:hypothetical protein